MMMSLGVYLLGAADDDERRRLEAHLEDCRECLAELKRMAPLPGLLAAIPESVRDKTSSPRRQVRRLRRVPARDGMPRHWTATAAGAVAAFAAAAGVGGGLWVSSAGAGHQAAPLTLVGANTATHVSATATLTATSWGTSIQLQIRGAPENVECRLVVRSRAGRSEVTGVWDAWQKGQLSIPASASWLPSDIASLQITTAAKSLLTISAEKRDNTTGGTSR
jgi:hypothetical protein